MTLQSKPEKTDNAAEMRNRRSGTKRLGCMTHSLRHSSCTDLGSIIQTILASMIVV